jgi:hypothetical protein
MPTIVRLSDSIRICMDAGDHDPPHFHVLTGDGKAFLMRLDTRQVLAGTASTEAFAVAVAWAVDHRETLAARWSDLDGR